VGAVVPLSVGGGAGSLFNNVAWAEAYLRTRPNSIPSGIHPTVSPQYTNVTDTVRQAYKTDRTSVP